MNRFVTLLKREYWEHRGGFFWAPIITGAIFLIMTLLFGTTLTIFAKKQETFDFNGVNISVGKALSKVDAQHVGHALDSTLVAGVGIAFVVMLFVIFFYCLGSLYDDRKDRSILFWKSLPLSDRETVLSKLFTALVGAPIIALGLGLIIGVGLLLIAILIGAVNGVNVTGAAFLHTHPFQFAAKLIALLPLYIFWALPTIGWLMFCSAWAKSKPFLWAVLVPVLSGILVSWMDALPGSNIESDWYWGNVVARLLFSIVPGTWTSYFNIDMSHIQSRDGAEVMLKAMDLSSHYAAFATWQMWLGIAVGSALVYGAIHFRKQRELAD